MRTWIYLGLAIASEVTATASLKASEGFTKLVPSVVVFVGYMAAFYFLSLTLEDIPIGVAYAVWSGVGVAAITLISVFYMDQKIDLRGGRHRSHRRRGHRFALVQRKHRGSLSTTVRCLISRKREAALPAGSPSLVNGAAFGSQSLSVRSSNPAPASRI